MRIGAIGSITVISAKGWVHTVSQRTYASYALSQAERERAQAAAREALRRQQEAERARERERQRLAAIARGRQADATAAANLATAQERQRQLLNDRLQAVLKAAAGAGERHRQTALALSRQLAGATPHQLPGLEVQVEQLEQAVRRERPAPESEAPGMTRVHTTQETRKLAGRLAEALATLPAGARELWPADLQRLEQILCEAVSLPESNLPAAYYQLRSALQELELLLSGGAPRLKDFLRQREQVHSDLERLLVTARVVAKGALMAAHAAEAVRLVAELETLQGNGDLSAQMAGLIPLSAQVEALAAQHSRALENAAERRTAMNIMAETLAELGYSVVTLPESANPPAATATQHLTVTSPEAEVVRANFDLGRNFSFEFLHEAGNDPAEAAEGCRQWCQSYDRLLAELQNKGLTVSEHWRIEPSTEPLGSIALPPEVANRVRVQKYDRRTSARRRP